MTTRSLLTVVFGVVVVVVAAVFIRSLVPPESPSGSLASLSTAAELPIFDRAGKKVDLSKEKGKIIVIHFWATWCPPCVDEIPELSEVLGAVQGTQRHRPLHHLGRQGLEGGRGLQREASEQPAALPRSRFRHGQALRLDHSSRRPTSPTGPAASSTACRAASSGPTPTSGSGSASSSRRKASGVRRARRVGFVWPRLTLHA